MIFFKKTILLPILILVLSLVIYFVFINSKPEAYSNKNAIELPLVEVHELNSDYYFTKINTYGEIITTKTLDIKYADNGKINKVGSISSGSYVKQGDLLFQVDSFEITNLIKQLEAEKNIIQFNIEKLSFQIESKKAYKQELNNQKSILEKQLENKESIEGKVISKNSLDDLRLSLSKLEEGIINIKEVINILYIELEQNKSELKKLNIIINRNNRDLDNTIVKAEFSGHIENFKIYEGQEISNNEVLGKLIDTKNLEVKFFLGGEDYNNLLKFMNKGIGSEISVEWLVGNKKYISKAIINRFDGELDKEIAGINLYANLINNENNIPLGAFVEVSLHRKIKDKVIKVPNSSVFNNSYIFIIEESRIKKIDIVIINEEQDGVLIQNNNLDGKELVITRLSNMKDNMKVQIVSNNK